MDFFKSGLKTVLGSTEPGAQPSGADIVERLVSRVDNSTLLEDRRDACRALKALSRKHRVEVGAQGLETLRQILEVDRADCEIVSYALDTLCNIVSQEQLDEERDNPSVPLNIGEQFTEMFLKETGSVKLLLELLEEYDFRVRLPAVRLLNELLAGRPKAVQEAVLISPLGVSKLTDLLGESREVIRNAALLLLGQLTRGNANIQKIVAFENAFDRLLDVIAAEGYAEGGIVVEDCLLLMLNLLKNNSSNQNLFREGNCIPRLLAVFPQETAESVDAAVVGWSAQRAANVHCALELVRALVSPSNPAQAVTNAQQLMRAAGLLQQLCASLMASGVPADILTETIAAVGEVVRGEAGNQEYLNAVLAPSDPPRPALVVLLMSMVNEKQPFTLRCAVLYCFECFLYKNPVGQSALVQTLLPSSTEVYGLTSGQLLCGGLFSCDALATWFSAVAMTHALTDNVTQKEQMLRVLLATGAGATPISLIRQCTLLLLQAVKLHSKVALLMLLSTWTSNCPAAVSLFLTPDCVAFLVSQICSNEHDDNEYLLQGMSAFLLAICIHFNDDSVEGLTADALRQLLVKRIGVETFVAKLGEVSKHEMYSRASKQPQIRAKSPGELLLDYEYCRLFKSLEGVFVSRLSATSSTDSSTAGVGTAGSTSCEAEPQQLQQYKTLIRQQDAKLQQLAQQLQQINTSNLHLKNELDEKESCNCQLRDENTLLRAQMAAMSPRTLTDLPNGHTNMPADDSSMKMKQYELKMHNLEVTITELENKVKNDDQTITDLNAEIERMKGDQDDLLELLADQDAKLTQYRSRLTVLGESPEE